MRYSIETTPIDTLTSDCLVVGVYTDQTFSGALHSFHDSVHELVNRLVSRGDFKGSLAETLLINVVPDTRIERLLLVGLGENKSLTAKQYRKTLASVINHLKKVNVKSAVCTLTECEITQYDQQWKMRQLVEVFGDALYQSGELKSKQETSISLDLVAVTVSENEALLANIGLLQGQAIAGGVNLAKRLGDLPGNICTPTYLAQQAIELGEKYAALSVNILEETEMAALGMGSLLSVARGSRQPAKLICLNYQGCNNQSKPIVLVGKGLTFDAGGISLKPGQGMDEMKYDMCGGAAVMGTLQAAAEMQLPLNIVGLIPASENLPDGNANKPGDIVTSMLGKTIEILNTDAEGRLILCDTLTYAERYNPDVVIDLATLTGACLVALGRVPSGLLGNDDELCNEIIAASEIASDSVWRLPLWEEYQELLKSNFADLANIGGKDAGTITAACFLSSFAENFRWAHLDIAGTAWRTGQNKGATGRPVPLLSQFLIHRAEHGAS